MGVVVGLYRIAVAVFALIGTQEIWRDGDPSGLVYFTNQSNLLLAVVFVWAGFASFARQPQPPAWLKGAVTLFILITGLVAYFILPPDAPGEATVVLGLTDGQIVHQLTPAMAFVDFLLFDPHRRLRIKNAALWLLYPVAYCAFTTVRGVVLPDTDYPYGFVDVAEIGYLGLVQNVVLYGVGFFVLGLVIVGIDRVLPRNPVIGPKVPAGSRSGGRSGSARGRGSRSRSES